MLTYSKSGRVVIYVLFPRQLSPKLPVVNLCFTETSDQRGNDTLKTTDEYNNGKKNAKKSSNGISHSQTLSNCDFLYNSNLNERQRAAVTRILGGQCRPTPYLLFGPPGTGKTVTLVEAILQVFHRIPSSRILACAPSNSASDLIAQRLHQSGFIQEGDMVRLNALQRGQEVPEIISQYCTDTDDLVLASHFRVVICTCSTSGQLFSLGLKSGHFTHVFVDEAGQATEPECLIPVGLAAGGEGQVILAGDPYQLGAVLRSPVALDFGLNISLLERLISRSLYKRDERKFSDHGCYDPLLVTKLVNNYRAHPSLLHPSSALFYHGELQVHADRTMRESLCRWELLPNPQVPIIFHGMKGEDLREGNSPSWFNPVEAVQVTKYIQALRTCKRCTVKLTDIGIITPYRKQVEKIRLLLSRLGLSDVKVGSVEEFQGQERMAIILSTVRSDEHLVDFDAKHCIGFLSNPKRFNVAITRAQALLVIVGNPHVLCKDPYWCTLLRYCIMNDAYTGCDLPNLHHNNDEESFHHVIDVLRVKSEEMKKDSSYHFVQGEVEAKGSCTTLSNNGRKPPARVQSGKTSVRQRTLISPLRTSKLFQDEFKNFGLNAISLFEEEISSAGDKDLLKPTEVSGENSLHTTYVKSEDSFNTADVRNNCSSNTAGLGGRDSMNKDNINGEESLKIANISGNEFLNTSDVIDDDPLNDTDVKGTTNIGDDGPLNNTAVKGTIGVGDDGPLNDTDVKGTTDVGDDEALHDTDVKNEQSLSPTVMKDDVRGKCSLNTTQYDNIEVEENSFSETHDGTNEVAGDKCVSGSITHLLKINSCVKGFKDANDKTPFAPSSLGTWTNDQNDLMRKGFEFNSQTANKNNSFRKEQRTVNDEQPYCDLTQNKCESACGVVTTTNQMDAFNLNVDVKAGKSESNISTDSEEELEEFLLKPVMQRKSPLR